MSSENEMYLSGVNKIVVWSEWGYFLCSLNEEGPPWGAPTLNLKPELFSGFFTGREELLPFPFQLHSRLEVW